MSRTYGLLLSAARMARRMIALDTGSTLSTQGVPLLSQREDGVPVQGDTSYGASSRKPSM